MGSGDILGASLTLDTSKELVVGDTTTVNTGGTLLISGGSLTTSTLLLDGGTFTAPGLSGINTLQFNSGTLNLTGPSGLTVTEWEVIARRLLIRVTYLCGENFVGYLEASSGWPPTASMIVRRLCRTAVGNAGQASITR